MQAGNQSIVDDWMSHLSHLNPLCSPADVLFHGCFHLRALYFQICLGLFPPLRLCLEPVEASPKLVFQDRGRVLGDGDFLSNLQQRYGAGGNDKIQRALGSIINNNNSTSNIIIIIIKHTSQPFPFLRAGLLAHGAGPGWTAPAARSGSRSCGLCPGWPFSPPRSGSWRPACSPGERRASRSGVAAGPGEEGRGGEKAEAGQDDDEEEEDDDDDTRTQDTASAFSGG